MSTSVGPVTITAPVASLIFQSMLGIENMGRLYQYDLRLLSDNTGLKPSDMLGQTMAVHLETHEQELRHFHGYITDFALTGAAGDYAEYSVTLRPWLWFLTRVVDCRIFQHMSAVDVIRKVFRDHGFTDFEESLTNSYESFEYIVQYRETDFNFVSRLMEQEGIYYYFKHSESRHSLVLCDSRSAHDPAPGYESIRFGRKDAHRAHVTEYIDEWQSSYKIQTGAVALNDYDFERPNALLLARKARPSDHAKSDFEVYDYPGGYTQRQRGDDLVQHRLEELDTAYAKADGHSNARGISTGSLFTLKEHPVGSQNVEYLVVSARYQIRTHDPRSAQAAEGPVYECDFSVIESAHQFRSACVTRKPIVGGPQTAMVVGKAGEEIWTDEHARVKVKFHWDRLSDGDENSSCWVRVAQVWAGDKWGGIHIPRIGQEVIVDFLEGNPDRPIITGRVYNGMNHAPYDLPAKQTQSGIKSRSTKNGGVSNANEIRFEDSKGSEELYIQAEKNKNVLVKNDRSTSIGNNDKLEIKVDRQKKIGNNETIEVGVDRKDTVGANEKISIGANRDEKIGANLTQNVTGNVKETVGGNAEQTVTGNVKQTVMGSSTRSVMGSVTQTVMGSQTQTITGSLTQTVVGGVTIATPAAVTISAAGGFNLVAPGGTKTVDNQFWKTGGASGDLFGYKIAILGAKTDIIAGLTLLLANNKVDIVSMKVDQALTKFANNPTTIKSVGMAIMQGYCNLHTLGLVVIA